MHSLKVKCHLKVDNYILRHSQNVWGGVQLVFLLFLISLMILQLAVCNLCFGPFFFLFLCHLCFQVKAKGTLMQMVAADWLRSNKREDDLGGRPGSIVQVNS